MSWFFIGSLTSKRANDFCAWLLFFVYLYAYIRQGYSRVFLTRKGAALGLAMTPNSAKAINSALK